MRATRKAYMSPQGDIYAGISSETVCIYRIGTVKRNDQNSVDVMNRLQDVGIGCEKARSPNAYTHIQYADLF